MTGFDGKYVTTGQYRTHYIEEGDGDPVILLHGGGAGADSVSNWSTCLPVFAKRKRAIALDMVGFGYSDKPAPSDFTYSQDARNAQLVAFIEGLGLKRVSIVGNSMGGATALGVAMRRPDLVDSLVLMGSAGIPGDVKMSPALAPVLHYDFTLEGMRRIIAVLANPDYVASDEQIRYRYEQSLKPDTRAAYTAIMRWVGQNGFGYSFEDIKEIKTRTLVVNGKDDQVVPIENAFKFLELLENSTGYLMPHCRHWAMIEYPNIFSNVVLDFIDAYGAYQN